ncbi:ribosomal protein S18 acetylase RimI-like enzyme [Cryobacterium sp. CAN_C3]|uniref:GNAT family N-acetyltransferase n=1 Tax=Cryobacterium sp. CAN_C3 TaxID=3071721 RepID=UPI0018CBDA76|nr:GNAT family N-acetyltransferase [Cryobacterium sp. CAN_C3]MEC5153607.1 ribosomal protein S18 acetylase RimI-like enzyme [Cryobacterium sp. CAN_C3]
MLQIYRREVPTASPNILYTSPTDPLAAPMVAELSREYDERYGLNNGIPSSVELSRYPSRRFQPVDGGTFLLLVENGRAVAAGAFMRADAPDTVEVKRVWTHSAHRRRGLARQVMVELEAEAARRAIPSIVLTTGPRQPEAVALYVALGYEPQFDLDAEWESIGYLEFRKRLPSSDDERP